MIPIWESALEGDLGGTSVLAIPNVPIVSGESGLAGVSGIRVYAGGGSSS